MILHHLFCSYRENTVLFTDVFTKRASSSSVDATIIKNTRIWGCLDITLILTPPFVNNFLNHKTCFFTLKLKIPYSHGKLSQR